MSIKSFTAHQTIDVFSSELPHSLEKLPPFLNKTERKNKTAKTSKNIFMQDLTSKGQLPTLRQ